MKNLNDASSISNSLVLEELNGVEGSKYFKHCKKVKDEIKLLLEEKYSTEHRFFLFHSTTHSLTSILLAFNYLKINFSIDNTSNLHYPKYLDLISKLSSNTHESTFFTTHLSPITGEAVNLSTMHRDLLIVDAAQTFGTVLHDELISAADIFIAPLHKHIATHIGCGIIAVKKNNVLYKQLEEILLTLESGTRSYNELTNIKSKLINREARYNNALIKINDEVVSILKLNGIELISTNDSHMVCFKFKCISSIKKLNEIFNLKINEEYSVARLSILNYSNSIHRVEDFSKSINSEILKLFKKDLK